MVKCSGVKKPNCLAPCEWTVGKGCNKSVKAATPAKPKTPSPSKRIYAFLGFKDDDLKTHVEKMNNKVTYGIKTDTTHIVYKKDKRVMEKVEAFSGPKLELSAFIEKYGFSSKKAAKAAAKAPSPAKPVAKPSSKPAGCVPSKLKKYVERKAPPYPAAECCGITLKGNDGNEYVSKPDKNGICKWYKAEKAVKPPTPKAAKPPTPKAPTPKAAKPPTPKAAKPPKPTKAAKPPKAVLYKLTYGYKRESAEGLANLVGKRDVEYDGYNLSKIYKHAKGACLGMFKDDNDIRGVVEDVFYYVPSQDLFVIALKARCDTDRKDKDLNTVYGVEFTYDLNRKYMIEVEKNAMVLLDEHKATAKELVKDTDKALKIEYPDAVLLPC